MCGVLDKRKHHESPEEDLSNTEPANTRAHTHTHAHTPQNQWQNSGTNLDGSKHVPVDFVILDVKVQIVKLTMKNTHILKDMEPLESPWTPVWETNT